LEGASSTFAEFPEFRGRTLVVMDQVVELELIKLAGVELSKAGAHMLEEFAQLLLVVRSDRLACGSALGLLNLLALGVLWPRHVHDGISAGTRQHPGRQRCPPLG